MSGEREFAESPVTRAPDETFPYSFDVSTWLSGSTYSNAAATLYDSAGATVPGALSGSASFSGSTLTTPDFAADEMTAGRRYRLHVSWQVDGKTLSAYLEIWCEAKQGE